MQYCNLSFVANCYGGSLRLTVRLNNQTIFDNDIQDDPVPFKHCFPDEQTEGHVLEIELSGKQPEDTEIDYRGVILKDKLLEISDFILDGVDLSKIIYQHAVYTHNHNNPTKENTQQPFYGIMGCNGTVRFEFSSPTYIWLLENM